MAKYWDRKFNIKLIVVVLLILLLVFAFAFLFKKNNNNPIDIFSCNLQVTADSPSDMHLPIVVIDTHGQKLDENISKTTTTIDNIDFELYENIPKYEADFKLYDSCTNTVILEEKIIISLRGQSSLVNPKKQYGFTFIDENQLEKKVEVLGLPSESKWILNGTYLDKTVMRNYLAYNIGSQMMDYAPRSKYVEVYLNDTNEELSYSKHFLGLYLITEKIERSKNRVNISKVDERYNDVSFIVARDKIKVDDKVYNTYYGNLEEDYILDINSDLKLRSVIKGVYPGKTTITDEYQEKITSYLNDFEVALYSASFKDESIGYRKYIDVNSFIDMALINEIFKNIDGCEVSAYFYKDIGGLLRAGPIWDFDLSLGNTDLAEVNEPTGFRMVNTIWFNRLFQDEYFSNMYKKRYQYFRNSLLSDESIIKMIDETMYQLSDASDRNYEMWYPTSILNYSDEVNDMKDFLLERLSWMDKNIDNVYRYEEVID